jgi:uncharacterized membrane protein
MKLKDYKLVFVAVGLIGIFGIASPVIGTFLPSAQRDQFSELYLLGQQHTTKGYPFNITAGQSYSVYVGVANHLGSTAYYALYVKLRNQTDLSPDPETGTPIPMQSLYEYRFSIKDGENWEEPLTFSALNVSISANQSVIGQLMINGVKFEVNKPSLWSSNSSVFFYQLVLELWRYDVGSGSIQFNDRYVSLPLNLTSGSY